MIFFHPNNQEKGVLLHAKPKTGHRNGCDCDLGKARASNEHLLFDKVKLPACCKKFAEKSE